MQIRRNENLLFPSIRSNAASNNTFLKMVKAAKEDTSATVTISKAGRARARMLDESSKKDGGFTNYYWYMCLLLTPFANRTNTVGERS